MIGLICYMHAVIVAIPHWSRVNNAFYNIFRLSL